MRKPLIAANWKMHGSQALLEDFSAHLQHSQQQFSPLDIILLPPAVYLPLLPALFANTGVHWGAQNVSHQASGAYTGDIAASMVAEFESHYALVGHSERRHYFHESDALIAKKLQQAQSAGLTPILCVGETLEQRENGHTFGIIKAQLEAVFQQQKGVQCDINMAIAYEPVWAIGTGKTATPEQAQEVHGFIRSLVAQHQGEERAQAMPIIYGGSVKSNNIASLLAQTDIDGGLVGGASLNIDDFMGICQCSL
jgi:triosephosphate isomerase